MRRISRIGLLLLACCGKAGAPVPLVPATRAAPASAEWWNGAVVYEVFVRSFRDSDGDGSGDLAGLMEKLDYLNDGNPATETDLGVDAIWLMPIHPSPSYHGYDVTDYDGVNPQYGTLAQIDLLIAACHRRGIKVVLDFVPNHTSSQHPWFLDSRTSSRRDWYLWSGTNPGWTQPFGSASAWHEAGNGAWYYGVFWSGMPDLNWRNPAVRAEMDGIASRWLARGVDGFRLDAVRYLAEDGAGLQQDRPDTHVYLAKWSANVLAANPHAMLVGEAWADTATIATYFGSAGDGDLPLFFNFPLAEAVVDGVSTRSARVVAAALDSVARSYRPGAADAPFLTNHDQERVASRLGADRAKLKLAASILLTLQGTPTIYYGEEIGMRNGTCSSDECKRAPMAWDGTTRAGFTTGVAWWPHAPGTATANVASQTDDPSSLLSRYRQLIRVRKASPALSRGGTRRLSTENANVLSYLRTEPGGETVLAAHNFGASGATLRVGLPGTSTDTLLADPGATVVLESDAWSLSLPPYGSGIWRLR